jgi:hypothetical protein
MPIPVKLLFLGEDAVRTALLIVALFLALVALAAAFRRKVLLTAGLLFPLVYLMIFIRDEVRAGYVKPFFTPESLKVLPQYSPLVLLFVTMIGAIVTIAWMLRKVILEMKKEGRI